MVKRGKDTPVVAAAEVLAASLQTFGPAAQKKRKTNKNKKK
jgi:hypothetical protein